MCDVSADRGGGFGRNASGIEVPDVPDLE